MVTDLLSIGVGSHSYRAGVQFHREKVKDVPELLKKYRASKKCYEATELLQNTGEKVESDRGCHSYS